MGAAFTNLGLPGDVGFCVFLCLGLAWHSVMGGRLFALDREATDHRGSQLPQAASPGLL